MFLSTSEGHSLTAYRLLDSNRYTMATQTVETGCEVEVINLRQAAQEHGWPNVVMKNNQNKSMGHVPNGYLVQLLQEHRSGSSKIRTHDWKVGWVKTANLHILAADELVIARAKMLEDVAQREREEHEYGVENTVDSDPTARTTASSTSAPSEAGKDDAVKLGCREESRVDLEKDDDEEDDNPESQEKGDVSEADFEDTKCDTPPEDDKVDDEPIIAQAAKGDAIRQTRKDARPAKLYSRAEMVALRKAREQRPIGASDAQWNDQVWSKPAPIMTAPLTPAVVPVKTVYGIHFSAPPAEPPSDPRGSQSSHGSEAEGGNWFRGLQHCQQQKGASRLPIPVRMDTSKHEDATIRNKKCSHPKCNFKQNWYSWVSDHHCCRKCEHAHSKGYAPAHGTRCDRQGFVTIPPMKAPAAKAMPTGLKRKNDEQSEPMKLCKTEEGDVATQKEKLRQELEERHKVAFRTKETARLKNLKTAGWNVLVNTLPATPSPITPPLPQPTVVNNQTKKQSWTNH